MFHARQDEAQAQYHRYPWYKVLWLTGVDYFSTLGYQPGLALIAAGALAPLATGILLVVTLFGALPVYSQIARRSYAGQGSIAMLESLLPGWLGKLFVLILLGFAGTDFVITMTLSAADGSKHLIENAYLKPYLGETQLVVTLVLLGILAIVFLKGFKEAIGLARIVTVPYLLLNAVVIARGLLEIISRPETVRNWHAGLLAHGDWSMLFIGSALIFPRLALGLSGFETGVTVMPLIDGGVEDRSAVRPAGKIRATKKLLAAAALIMSVLLISSSFVTTLLVPEEAYGMGGPAAGRAMAYLAHGYLGSAFGSVYDFSTILILWFAGASAMTGLVNLIPRYLPRFGMAPRWVAFIRPLVLVLFAVDVIVTVAFGAGVEAQAGAYATGVLALICSAAFAVALAHWSEAKTQQGRAWTKSLLLCLYSWVITAVFAFTLFENIRERPDGLIIALIFTIAIMVLSGISRYFRSTELRVSELALADEESARLWPQLAGRKVNVVPTRTCSPEARTHKAAEIRKHYAIAGPLAFVHVTLVDNRSDFLARLELRVRREGENFVIEVFGAVAIANTLAYLSELIDPISLFLGLSRQGLTGQALKYLLFGEGEVGLMVYTILVRYWHWTPEEDVRPLLFLMSE